MNASTTSNRLQQSPRTREHLPAVERGPHDSDGTGVGGGYLRGSSRVLPCLWRNDDRTMVNRSPPVRLREAPTDTRVRLHYENTRGEIKTETGVKTGTGGPIEAAEVEIQTESDEETSRTLRIGSAGSIEVEESNEGQQVGQLRRIEFPDKNTTVINLEHPDEIDWLAKGRQVGGISTSKALREHTYRATKELLQGAGGPLDADPSTTDVDAAHSDFRDAVNMTADDLRAWENHDCSDAASVKPAEVRQRVRDLLTTPTDDWSTDEVADAHNVADFITRLKDAPRGDPAREDCPPTRDVTLMNWGYVPDGVDVDF